MKKLGLIAIIILLTAAAGATIFYKTKNPKPAITNFEECAAAGNPIMESYPRQCRVNGQTFVEIIEQPAPMTETEARAIAEVTCIKGGEALGSGYYNENSKTWWFDANLNATPAGCNPACVVSGESKTAEINWMCTGAISPPTETLCDSSQGNAEVCAQIYSPVCATVEIQCIRAPCNPIKETFSNSCEACRNSLVKSYTQGKCSPK